VKSKVYKGTFIRQTLAVFLATVLAINAFIFCGTSPAFAEPTSAEKQAEVDEVAAKLHAWLTELEQATHEYYAAIAAHDEAIVRMGEAQERIDAAQALITETQARLGARASIMYKNGPLSFLDVLFGATSFGEFTSRWILLNNMNRENANLIAQNRTAKQEAETAFADFTAQEQFAADRLAEAEAIRANAERIVANYEAELASLEAEVAELVRQEQEAIRAREQARIAAEQAAANSNNASHFYIPPTIPVGGYNSVVEAAYSRIGCPYVWAGKGPDVFDCSGLTRWCYLQAGFRDIGASDYYQYQTATARLPLSEARPGDVLWWSGHVAIYIGDGKYIHAPSPGYYVEIQTRNINNAVVLRF